MRSLVKLGMMLGTFLATLLALNGNAQESQQPATRSRESASPVIPKLRDEAAKMGTARFSKLFSALSDKKIRAELRLTAEQADLAGRLEKLTRDVIKAWLLRDLDATPPPSADVLSQRLSERGDRLRTRIVAHAEAMLIEGILTPRQRRICTEATGRKDPPLMSRREPPRPFIPDETFRTYELAQHLRERAV